MRVKLSAAACAGCFPSRQGHDGRFLSSGVGGATDAVLTLQLVAAARSLNPPYTPKSQLLPPAICPSIAGESQRAGSCQARHTQAHPPYDLDINERRELREAAGLLCVFDSHKDVRKETRPSNTWTAFLAASGKMLYMRRSCRSASGFHSPDNMRTC